MSALPEVSPHRYWETVEQPKGGLHNKNQGLGPVLP